MTLLTAVAIRLPQDSTVGPRQVLDAAIEGLCRTAADGRWGPHRMPVIGQPAPWCRADGVYRVGTEIGQGFHAITDVMYRPQGSAVFDREVTYRQLYPQNYQGSPHDTGDDIAYPPCTYLLEMDTAYGAHYNNGVNAWSLHLGAIAHLQKWVESLGGSLKFRDEATGRWFDGDDEDGYRAMSRD